MGNSRSKFYVFMLGLFLSCFVLEIALRVFGVVYANFPYKSNIFKKQKGSFVLLCVGDSFTQGIGASLNNAYPAQLQQIFKQRHPEMNVKIVNKGLGGSNSTMVLDRLVNDLESIKPDIVIILAGGSNVWNAYGYTKHLETIKLKHRFFEFLNTIKIYKLIKLFILEIENKKLSVKHKFMPIKTKEFSSEMKKLWIKAYEYEWEKGGYDKAIVILKQMLAIEPDNVRVMHALGRINFNEGNIKESKKYYRQAIDSDPVNNVFSYSDYAIRFISDPLRNKEDFEFLAKYADKNPIVMDILKSVVDKAEFMKDINQWISDDINKMISIAQQKGIKVVIQDYPDYIGNYASINSLLSETAKKHSLVFVDNDGIFKELFLKGEVKESYFAFDKSHCNDKGYKIIAQNIYNSIMAGNLIKKSSFIGHNIH